MAISGKTASPALRTQRIAWHHVRATIPADWEVAAYSVEDRAGRLEFATRRGLMGVASWEPCEREPDRRTTMVSFLQRNVLGANKGEREELKSIQSEQVGPFLVGWLEAGGPCQALAYCAAEKKLIRWIIEPAARESDAASAVSWTEFLSPILKSCDFNEDECIEYRIHGLHARLPRAYQIEDMTVLPANVMISFENLQDKRRATFRRWGLPDMILEGRPLGVFHARILKTSGITTQSSRACRVVRQHEDGHRQEMEACLSEYEAPREHHMDRFMARRWKGGAAVVWHDREARRLYTFEQVGPAKSTVLDFAATLPGLTLVHEA